MKVEFKDVAKHYIGCEVEYPNTDGSKPLRAKLTGVTSDGYETTYKRKKNGCRGDLVGFKDGRERGHNCYAENCKPVLKSLYDLTDHELINAISPMQYGLNSLSGLEQIKQCAEITKFLLSKHYDQQFLLFNTNN